jgi:hypothetical protein
MTITWPVLLAVLLGALLHASWNALVKSSQDKTLDTALIHLLCSVLAKLHTRLEHLSLFQNLYQQHSSQDVETE